MDDEAEVPLTAAEVVDGANAYADRTVPALAGRAWRVITALLFVTAINGAVSLGGIIVAQSARHAVAVSKTRADGGRAAVCTALALNSARAAAQVDLPPACGDEAVAPLLPPSVCVMFHQRPPRCAEDWPSDLRG